jgi:hypothetical protein
LDHTFGNIAYERQKIPIMAHERAPALMKERYAALLVHVAATQAFDSKFLSQHSSNGSLLQPLADALHIHFS